MKQLLFVSFLAMSLCLAAQPLQSINPVIGDISFVTKYGEQPVSGCDEKDRIKTHLAYVEEQLRAANVSGLSAEQLEKRTEILDHLQDYWRREQFPVNSAYETERRPCFIDEKGTICAVGYLIEQTAGRAAAEAINDQYQYATIAEMTDKLPEIEQWANKNGLTINECAMIQPTYDYLRIVESRSRFGMYAGYTMAFAHIDESFTGGSIASKPGFEVALSHRYSLWKPRWKVQTSLGFVSRNFAVSGAGTTFEQRNERWFVTSLISYMPFQGRGPKWVQGLGIKAGLQIDFYNQSSPMTVMNGPNGTWNKVVKSDRPECLLVGELSYGLKPWRFTHSISVAYSRGLRNTLKGEVGRPSETALRYSNSGSYLSVKYTVWFKTPRRKLVW